MKLKNKVAFITGAGSGIGRATAIRFAAEGATVIAADRDTQAVEETRRLIEKDKNSCQEYIIDVSQESEVKEAMTRTAQQFGRLDILHNNAGISIIKPIVETTEADLDLLLNVNLKGVFFGCKHAIPIMVQQGGGVIINTASELSLIGQAFYSAYSATKGGIVALTRALAVEWAAKGIRVNAICPGPIKTPMLQAEFQLAADSLAEEAATVHSIPVGRLGEPEEIARVVLFLASEDAEFVQGAAIVADGGRTIA